MAAQVVADVKMLYRTVHPVPCSGEERQVALVAQARGGARLHAAQARLAAAVRKVSPHMPQASLGRKPLWACLILCSLMKQSHEHTAALCMS